MYIPNKNNNIIQYVNALIFVYNNKILKLI